MASARKMLMDIIEPTVEKQYGGGLDDAYMNRRRSSAFAAPDATSAFASPMSQGGLPTVYRFFGGTVDEVGGSNEYGAESFVSQSRSVGWETKLPLISAI